MAKKNIESFDKEVGGIIAELLNLTQKNYQSDEVKFIVDKCIKETSTIHKPIISGVLYWYFTNAKFPKLTLDDIEWINSDLISQYSNIKLKYRNLQKIIESKNTSDLYNIIDICIKSNYTSFIKYLYNEQIRIGNDTNTIKYYIAEKSIIHMNSGLIKFLELTPVYIEKIIEDKKINLFNGNNAVEVIEFIFDIEIKCDINFITMLCSQKLDSKYYYMLNTIADRSNISIIKQWLGLKPSTINYDLMYYSFKKYFNSWNYVYKDILAFVIFCNFKPSDISHYKLHRWLWENTNLKNNEESLDKIFSIDDEEHFQTIKEIIIDNIDEKITDKLRCMSVKNKSNDKANSRILEILNTS